jgi:mitochondrial fission protein ELM1
MPVSENTDALPETPSIWVLHGARTGDNQQVSALANALGWSVKEIFLEYFPWRGLPYYLIGATLNTVKTSSRIRLRPPWPDIVIASGRRSVAPARWIKRQSGGRAKLVQLGRPRAPLHIFDLVITTAQYGLPEADNVLSLTLPLQLSSNEDNQPPESLSASFSDLPRPWTGVLIGGTTWPFIINSRTASRLGRDLNEWLGRTGGSVLITTSPRSHPQVAETLEKTLDAPHFLHRWSTAAENPYRAILRNADRLIVTSDSVSMLADACRSGKPTAIWKTDVRRDPISFLFRMLGNQAHRDTPIGGILRSVALKGLFTPPRHVERLTDAVIADERATWFVPGCQIEGPRGQSGDDDTKLAIDRVRALFER